MKYGILLLVMLLAGFGCSKKADTEAPAPQVQAVQETSQEAAKATNTSRADLPPTPSYIKDKGYVITGKVHPDVQRMNKIRRDSLKH